MKTEINKLLDEAYRYKDEAPRKTELLQKAYALTQTLQDVEMQLEVGTSLIKAGQWSGNEIVTLPVFSQLLSLLDKNPEYLEEYSLLWEYKWIIMDLPNYPSITKNQIFDALKDMEIRYKKEGYHGKVINQYYSRIYLELGMFEEAKMYYLQSEESQTNDYMTDCTACVMLAQFKLYCHTESLEKALKIGNPILTEKYTCSSVPIGAYAYILPFLIKAGEMKLAKKMFKKYYKVKGQDSDFYHQPILYCIKSKQFTKALDLLGEDTSRFLVPSSSYYLPIKDLDDFYYALTFWYLCHQLEKEKKKKIKLEFYEDFILYKSTNSYAVEELKNFFKTETLALAKAFDQRNENTFISNQITETFCY